MSDYDMEKVADALPERWQELRRKRGYEDAEAVMWAINALSNYFRLLAYAFDEGYAEDGTDECLETTHEILDDAIKLARALVGPIGRDRTLRLLTTLVCITDALSPYWSLENSWREGHDTSADQQSDEYIHESQYPYIKPLWMMAAELVAVIRLDFSEVEKSNENQLSAPATHKAWENRFDKGERTLRRWRTEGFRMIPVPGKEEWRVHQNEEVYQEWKKSQGDAVKAPGE